MKVLVVEDDPSQLLLLETILLKEYDVLTAEDPRDALEIVKQQKQDDPIAVVLSDQYMPQMQGHRLLGKIASISEDTLGILLTGEEVSISILTSALNEGHIYGYLNKPCHQTSLLTMVAKAIELFSVRVLNKRLARELLAANQELEKQVQKRTQELEKQSSLLQERNEKLNLIQEEIEGQMSQAQTTQRSLLPASVLDTAHLKTCAKYVPLKKIGGDFYDVIQLRKDRYGLLVADVSGHDVAAALVSFMISGIFRSLSEKATGVLETVYEVNNQLSKNLEKGRFASMFYGVFNAKTSLFTYCSAGHPGALLIRKKDQELLHLRTKGGVIGVVPGNLMKFQKSRVELCVGDRLFLYTDALLEIESKNEESASYQSRLQDLEDRVKKTRDQPIEEALEFIYSDTLKQAGCTSYQDDFTLLAVELHPETH